MYYDKKPQKEPFGLLYQHYNNALRALRKRKAQSAEAPKTVEEELTDALTGICSSLINADRFNNKV